METNRIHRNQLLADLRAARINHLNRLSSIAALGWVLQETGGTHEPETLVGALKKLDETLRRQQISFEQYSSGLMLFGIVSEVELYFGEVVRHVLRTFPEKMGSTKFSLSDVLGSSREELVTMAAERLLNDLMYKKPIEYLNELCNILSVTPDKIEAEWPKFIEAKARRDIGIHNNWIINDVYLRKIKEAGLTSDFTKGNVCWPSNDYVVQAFDNCSKIIDAMFEMLEKKYDSDVS